MKRADIAARSTGIVDDPAVFALRGPAGSEVMLLAVDRIEPTRVVGRLLRAERGDDLRRTGGYELSEATSRWTFPSVVRYVGCLSTVIADARTDATERARTYAALVDLVDALDARLGALDGHVDVAGPYAPTSRLVLRITLDATAARALLDVLGRPEGADPS